MAGELSKTVYDTRDKAAMGGFFSVREHHKTEWERKEFGFFVVLVTIFFYLMNPFQELRYAQVEDDFL